MKIEKIGLIVFLVLALIKILLGQNSQITILFTLILIPLFHSYNLKKLDDFSKNTIHKGIIVFYIIECILAIYEKVTGGLVFSQKEEELAQLIDFQNFEFRSQSLLGHPLNNALCVSVIMSYILLSNNRKFYKYSFLLIGFLALICFDARAAIIIWILIFLFHFFKESNKNEVIYLLIGLIISYYIVESFQLGGRLFHSEILDGSALARVSVFDAFNFLSDYNFWFGNGDLYLKITGYLGAGGIENSFVVLVVDFGVVGALILIRFYWNYLSDLMNNLTSYSKFILFAALIILGSSNNGLLNPMPLFLFITCIFCFPFSRSYKIK
jgi:hypothetical protein